MKARSDHARRRPWKAERSKRERRRRWQNNKRAAQQPQKAPLGPSHAHSSSELASPSASRARSPPSAHSFRAGTHAVPPPHARSLVEHATRQPDRASAWPSMPARLSVRLRVGTPWAPMLARWPLDARSETEHGSFADPQYAISRPPIPVAEGSLCRGWLSGVIFRFPA